jgi:hydrogenase maturation protease
MWCVGDEARCSPSPQGEGENPTCRLVIGIGNPDRGDDGVGRMVAQRLRGSVPANVRIEEQDGGTAELIERLCDADSVWLIDAAVSGAPPGTIHQTDCTKTAVLPARFGASSHGLGVAEAIALARLLHGLPHVCMLYAIEGVTFSPGAAMSRQVLAAADALVARLAKELRSG